MVVHLLVELYLQITPLIKVLHTEQKKSETERGRGGFFRLSSDVPISKLKLNLSKYNPWNSPWTLACSSLILEVPLLPR